MQQSRLQEPANTAGFAVVAGEVKNLAGESKKASSQIESLIKGIQQKSEQTAGSMKTSFAEIKTGHRQCQQDCRNTQPDHCRGKYCIAWGYRNHQGNRRPGKGYHTLMTGIESVSTLTNDNQQRMEDMAALPRRPVLRPRKLRAHRQNLQIWQGAAGK